VRRFVVAFLGGAQSFMGMLHRLGMIHGPLTIRIIRTNQIRGYSRRSQDERGLAPWAAWGRTHVAMFVQASWARNRGKSLGSIDRADVYYLVIYRTLSPLGNSPA
jgi:hypothetical protein